MVVNSTNGQTMLERFLGFSRNTPTLGRLDGRPKPSLVNNGNSQFPHQTRIVHFFGSDGERDGQHIPPYGAGISPKDTGMVRIAFQNINGLNLQPLLMGLKEVDAMDAFDIDIFGLAETKTSWTTDNILTMSTNIKLKFGTSSLTVSSAPSNRTGFLAGGTAMIARGKVAGRTQKRGRDPMGRFSWVAFRGSEGLGVLIITAYRVCQQKGADVGTGTAHKQQYMIMREAGVRDPDPRNAIFAAISKLIQEWNQLGYHPIVMMDANAVATEKRFADFRSQHGLRDIIAENNDGNPPTTYSHGPNRLDYILGDDHIYEAVIQSGALGLHEGVMSDHTLQYVDFSETQLFSE